jgi:S-adenosylmethionine-diacylglycerol 3-amino-3-carboxypropyl transferase
MSTLLLRDAVETTPALSRRGVLDRLFTLWFRRLVYTQIWEDPAADVEALALGPGHRLVTIASGGCNVLNYLCADPAEVVALDLNPAHVALTRLKLAALAHLPDHDSFFRMFGHGDDAENGNLYRRYLRSQLDRVTRDYWDAPSLDGGRRYRWFERGFYRRGALGRHLGMLRLIARSLGGDPADLLIARTQAEQVRIFERTLAPLFDLPPVRWLCRQPLMFYGLGIPPAQFAALMRDGGGDIAALYRDRVRRLACDFPIRSNYFAWQAFGRRYDIANRIAIPDYLRAENFSLLRARASRASVRVASMTDFLSAQPPASFDRFVLLDAQDWMDGERLVGLWRAIDHAARPSARVLFRTAARNSPLETALPIELLANWRSDRALGERLLARDRSAIYGGLHVYVRRN